MKLPSLAALRQVPVVVYLVVGGVALASGWLAIDRAFQRQQGRFDEQMKTVRAASDSSVKVLTDRNATLDSLVAISDAAAARNQAAKHASDVQAGHLKTARDSLAQVVADSLATIEELRARAARMIAASDATEAARKVERQTADSAAREAKRSLIFAVDSVRAAAGTALDAMRHRAELAERLTKVRSTGLRAALLSRCGVIGGVGGVQSGGRLYAGPAVTVGCRLLP